MLQSPEIAYEIAAQNRRQPAYKNAEIEKRIREIDKEISKFMELYRLDGIPPELLADNIKKLHNEKMALQSSLESVVEDSFNLVEELLCDAAQIWTFADEFQKRRILQSLIERIVLTDDDVNIEWSFAK